MKRKGGAEVLKAFDQLRKKYDSFSLTFVGKLNDNYNNFFLDAKEKEEIQRIITHADWLEYHERLSNEEVLKLAKQAHVGLLPSMGDTFGFSVLEMQACGCPVITTDRQALPEINHDQCGWLINTRALRLTHGDDFAHYTRDEVNEFSALIRERLIHSISAIMDNPELLIEKAILAQERIKNIHNPEFYAENLKRIYRRNS